MRRMRELLRIPVILEESGDKLGLVKDILFDETENMVNGIIVEKDSLINSQIKIIPRADIISFGKESVLLKKISGDKTSGTSWSEKVGSKVYDGDGAIKGTIEDIFVDNLVKKVLGYEISDGLFSDLFKGRQVIFEENILAESEDVVVVEGGSMS
ncbi:MAG: hypothetical protein GX351_04150 [Peptococcaceae bacterium]|nr:hypothetical protein [Peptococcaceae bacterium]